MSEYKELLKRIEYNVDITRNKLEDGVIEYVLTGPDNNFVCIQVHGNQISWQSPDYGYEDKLVVGERFDECLLLFLFAAFCGTYNVSVEHTKCFDFDVGKEIDLEDLFTQEAVIELIREFRITPIGVESVNKILSKHKHLESELNFIINFCILFSEKFEE